jgi:hypothetical protein
MTFFESRRSRYLIAAAALLAAATLSFLFAHRIAQVQAARRAMAAMSGRIATEPASMTNPGPGTTPVLVELFTSEGCSSCPPADALLAHLQQTQPVRNANILVLEEHVDYWDSLGWHDRFSSHDLTLRQSFYEKRLHLDDDYTPQMIIDGNDQFVGDDSDHALQAIEHAARVPKLSLSLSPLTFSNSRLAGEVSAPPSAAPLPNADIYAAVVQAMATTQVLKGENGGHTLNHVSIVRNLQRIGSLADLTASSLRFSLDVPTDTPAAGLGVIVFAQRVGLGPVLGAVSSTTTASPATTNTIASQSHTTN